MIGKFGINTGSTLRRRDINRIRAANNQYEIKKEVKDINCNNMVLNYSDLTYSLNKMKRWELLDNFPSKGRHNIYFQNNNFLEKSGDDIYFKTQSKVNVKLIVKLQEPLHIGDCFKYYEFQAFNGDVSELFWQKNSKDFFNIHSLHDIIHKRQLENINDPMLKKKEKKNWKNKDTGEIDITYTVYIPNPLSAYPFKPTKYRNFFKNNKRKKRKRLCLHDFEDELRKDYDDEIDYNEDEAPNNVCYDDDDNIVGEDNDEEEVVQSDKKDSEEWVYVDDTEFSNNNEDYKTSTLYIPAERAMRTFCLLDYINNKKKTQPKRKNTTMNSINHMF